VTPEKDVSMTTNDVTVALVVRLHARATTADDLAGFLAGAVTAANDEAGTVVWLALRTDERTFWIVDAFPTERERQDHLAGPIAAALMEHADRLLAEPPLILPAAVLAAKLP
jgi:quinol monooxygenase YgiN